MANSKELVSEELRQQVEDLAREQHRDASEILEEAVNRYAAGYRLSRLQNRLGARAGTLGISESDIPQLVQQVRDENRRTG